MPGKSREGRRDDKAGLHSMHFVEAVIVSLLVSSSPFSSFAILDGTVIGKVAKGS